MAKDMKNMMKVVFVVLFLSADIQTAQAGTPQFDLGFSVQLNDQETYLELQKTTQPKGRYFSWVQPTVPDRFISFESLRELISFYNALAPSVKANGLWIRLNTTFARRPTKTDLQNLEDLKQAAIQNDILLFVCLPEGKENSRFGFIWQCLNENAASHSRKIVCEGKPVSSKGYWTCAEEAS